MNSEPMTPATSPAGVVVELPLGLGEEATTFHFEKAVCSHGLFMMAPNRWDPQSKTLERPLRLEADDRETSFVVRVSHPPCSPQALQLHVLDAQFLCPQQQQSLLSQVRRMLRLSEEEGRRVREFQEAHQESKGRGFGRIFRSPNLFEDMVKCMLLCNCQWSRTLSMAQALCDLQLELQHPCVIAENGTNSVRWTSKMENFFPNTPVRKESKKMKRVVRCSRKLINGRTEDQAEEENSNQKIDETAGPCQTSPFSEVSQSNSSINLCINCYSSLSLNGIPNVLPLKEAEVSNPCSRSGNFPSPKELAKLDEEFLAKRCRLGYRAGRILSLAREIAEGKIQLPELEDSCGTLNLADYDKLVEKLKVINGFGPFTRSNVLMCMGFYHIIPTDSETIRHLKQVHGKTSKIRTVQTEVEIMYGKYAPYQFLAYWSEVWHFYEEWFGKFSEMPVSSYKLITAANMRPKVNGSRKRLKGTHSN